jgi:hypothetical protein
MLHAKMMPLLAEVYKGRIDSDHAMLNEYGGQKTEAQIVEGGVKFAAVDQVGPPYLGYLNEWATDVPLLAA